jgi:hypothetical protein
METLLCAAVVTTRHQYVLKYVLCTEILLCAAGHSKESALVRSMYCGWRPYGVHLYVQQVIRMGQKHVAHVIDL